MLGEPVSTLVSGAWQLVIKIYDIFKEQNQQAKVTADMPVRIFNEEHHLLLGLPPLDDLRWRYLQRLMSLRRFYRIWFIPEVVLSNQDPIILHEKHVMLGRHSAGPPLGYGNLGICVFLNY